ncbi:MAG: recombinase family protein [Clostridia bacterium]|nr:recombinase family protein [Clostridia bacterium]
MAGRKSKYSKENENQKNLLKVAVYVRLSVEDGVNDDESSSITNQKKLVTEYLKGLNNVEIYDYYVDDGYTGTNFKRPEFNRMIGDIKDKKVNAVAVKDLSRLGRNHIQLGNYLENIFPLLNVKVISVNENQGKTNILEICESVNNSFYTNIKNLLNEEYSRDISQKVKSVIKTKREKGKCSYGLCAYGYLKDPNDIGHLIVDKKVSDIVKRIFNLYISGTSLNGIATILNKENILAPTVYRNPKLAIKKIGWELPTIKLILRNEVYCGDLIQGKFKKASYKDKSIIRLPKEQWHIKENSHEAIITRDVFNKAQEILDKNPCGVNKQKRINIYMKVLKCYDCKKAMRKKTLINIHNGKEYQYIYFRCSSYTVSKKFCSRHQINVKTLDKVVLESVKFQISLVLEVGKAIKEIKKARLNSTFVSSVQKQMEELIKKRDKAEFLKKKIYEDFKLNNINLEVYKNMKEEYEKEIIELNEKIDALKLQNEEEIKILNNTDWIKVFEENRNIEELDRSVIETLIKTIYVYKRGKISIVFKYEDEYNKVINYIKERSNEDDKK